MGVRQAARLLGRGGQRGWQWGEEAGDEAEELRCSFPAGGGDVGGEFGRSAERKLRCSESAGQQRLRVEHWSTHERGLALL